jgi:hypothetical protein
MAIVQITHRWHEGGTKLTAQRGDDFHEIFGRVGAGGVIAASAIMWADKVIKTPQSCNRGGLKSTFHTSLQGAAPQLGE